MNIRRATLLFFIFLCSALQADEWSIEIAKDRNTITIEQPLQVIITSSYPVSYQPDVFEFMQKLKEQDAYGFFKLNSFEVKSKASPLKIVLTLLPERSGVLIFAPPSLTFSPLSEQAPLHWLVGNGFTVECIAPTASLDLAPLLPVHPEQAIVLSAENKKQIFEDPKALQKEAERNRVLATTRSNAWTYLAYLLFGAGSCVALFWFMMEYEAAHPPKEKVVPTRNFSSELVLLAHSENDPLTRFSKLSRLLRDYLSVLERAALQGKTCQELAAVIDVSAHFSYEEKEQLKDLFFRLEAIEFSGLKVDEDEWQKMISNMSTLVQKAI